MDGATERSPVSSSEVFCVVFRGADGFVRATEGLFVRSQLAAGF